jgi:hydrogenase maturation protease
VVIGVGNDLRGDDAAGLEVVRRLRRGGCAVALELFQGDGAGLIELWRDAQAVVLVDATRSGTSVGTIHRFDASTQPLPAAIGRASSHAIGVADAIELARSLDRLPRRVIVFGVEGARFEVGAGLSEGVVSALDALAQTVRREILALAAEAAARSGIEQRPTAHRS